MAKWDFKIVGASFVKELVPIADDVQPRSQSFMQPSFHLEGGKIVMKESGQYVTAIYFPQIGEIGGVAPTDIDDAYAKLLTLVENFNGGGVTPQTLAETLAEDNKTNDIPIVSNNGKAVVDVNDDYLQIGYEDSYGISGITFDSPSAMYLESFWTIDLKSLQMSLDAELNVDINTNILNYNSEEVATQDWVTSQLNIPFEIQVTQALTSAPTILSGSANGLRGATLTTSYINIGEYNIISDLPIFADAKDCYKGSRLNFNLITDPSGALLYAYFWYISDDYTIVLKTSFDGFTYVPGDGVLSSPVLIKIEYNN